MNSLDRAYQNLKTAVEILDRSNINRAEWAFGGGTALMFEFRHRFSRDIDIFFHYPDYLSMLSPRLNDYTEELADSYTEQSNFLKLYIQGFEIDFIVAPNLTGILPGQKQIRDLNISVEHPIEIIAKKLYYRPQELKLRDIIDTAVVFSKFEGQMVEIFKKNKILPDKEMIDLSLKRLDKTNIENTLKELSLEDKEITIDQFEQMRDMFIEFLDKLYNTHPNRKKKNNWGHDIGGLSR